MNRCTGIIILVFSLFMQGCVTSAKTTGRNINYDDIPDLSQKAILFGVLSKQGGGSNASLFVRQSGSNLEIHLHALNFLRGIKDIDEKGREGRLFAISVNPGEYYLSGGQLDVLKKGKQHSSFAFPLSNMKFPFHATPGDIIYLGSFNVKAMTKRNHFNLPVVSGAELEVSQQLKRDKTMLLYKYPALSSKRITDQSMLSMKWRGQLNQP